MYGTESEAVAVATTTAGSVHTMINDLRQSQDQTIFLVRHDTSYICNGQTPGDQYVEQTAVYE
jgi:hypothetical protein